MPRESKPKPKRWNWRLVFSIAALALVCVSTAVAALKVRRFVVADPQFLLSRSHKDAITLEGVHYASRSKIFRVFAPDFDRSIFTVSLGERRRELLALDWVADASVSRMWPDRLVVRVRERQPIAFVNTRAGVLLIDASGVLLDPPPQAQFTFPVLNGVRERDSEEQRRDRVRTFLRLQDDMGYLLKDVSEVDVTNPDDIRLVAQVGNRARELLLGDANFARRYQNFLAHYSELDKRSPDAKVFDLRLDDRITVKE